MIDDNGVAPGWYPDPGAPGTQRYWDGEQWVGQSLPIGETAPEGPLMPPPEPATPSPPPGFAPEGIATSPPGFPTGNPQRDGARTDKARTDEATFDGRGSDTATPGDLAPGSPAAVATLAPGLVLASLSSRFTARVIDISVVFALNIVANGWFVYQFVEAFVPFWRSFTAWSANGGQGDPPVLPNKVSDLILVIPLILIAVWGAYEVPGVATTGQTLGKRLMGIKVIGLDTPDEIGVARSLRRWGNMSLPVLLWQCCGIGLVLQSIDAFSCVTNRPYQQCIHDRGVRTVVVRKPELDAGEGEKP